MNPINRQFNRQIDVLVNQGVELGRQIREDALAVGVDLRPLEVEPRPLAGRAERFQFPHPLAPVAPDEPEDMARARAAYCERAERALIEGRAGWVKKLIIKVIDLTTKFFHWLWFWSMAAGDCAEEVAEIQRHCPNVQRQVAVDLPRMLFLAGDVQLGSYEELWGALMDFQGGPLRQDLLDQICSCCQQGIFAKALTVAMERMHPRMVVAGNHLTIQIRKDGNQFVITGQTNHRVIGPNAEIWSKVEIRITPGPDGSPDPNALYSFNLEKPFWL